MNIYERTKFLFADELNFEEKNNKISNLKLYIRSRKKSHQINKKSEKKINKTEKNSFIIQNNNFLNENKPYTNYINNNKINNKNQYNFDYSTETVNFFSPKQILNIMKKNNNNNNSFYSNSILSSKYLQTQKTQKISKNKKILILDLDETLVHSSCNSPFFYNYNTNNNYNNNYNNNFYDFEYTIYYKNKNIPIYVYKRPYVNEFLYQMSKLFTIYIFTSSMKEYSNKLIDLLDFEKCIDKRYFRENCTKLNDLYVKDLNKLFDRKKFTNDYVNKNIIIIDNNPISYLFNHNNAIPIDSWNLNKNDDELLKLIPLLEYLSNVDDVSKVIKEIVEKNNINYFKLKKLIDKNNNNCCINNNKYNNNSIEKNKKSFYKNILNKNLSMLTFKYNNYNNNNNNNNKFTYENKYKNNNNNNYTKNYNKINNTRNIILKRSNSCAMTRLNTLNNIKIFNRNNISTDNLN